MTTRRLTALCADLQATQPYGLHRQHSSLTRLRTSLEKLEDVLMSLKQTNADYSSAELLMPLAKLSAHSHR